MLSNPEVLQPPNYNFEFELFTDASDVALGMVLKQCVNGVYRIIAFDGVKNNSTIAGYSTPKKELLAIKTGLKKFANITLGARTIVWTDHIAWTMEGRIGNVEADYISRNISYINTGDMDLITYIHEEITGHGSLLYVVEYIRDIELYNSKEVSNS
eukprot:TRINITY_DN7153_c0_g1_i1.p1 TRINITY_DN7153_c0_g1~~TRINITY_DN7153_c0_g1_i1.p1  ORF type:complete len:156 (-),score=15.95 TRINITY_DN7153_c0_g1_i1:30-497(-)